jgi:hypothetical protein
MTCWAPFGTPTQGPAPVPGRCPIVVANTAVVTAFTRPIDTPPPRGRTTTTAKQQQKSHQLRGSRHRAEEEQATIRSTARWSNRIGRPRRYATGTHRALPGTHKDRSRIARRLYGLLTSRAPPGTRTPNPRIKSPMLLVSANDVRRRSVPYFAAQCRSAWRSATAECRAMSSGTEAVDHPSITPTRDCIAIVVGYQLIT